MSLKKRKHNRKGTAKISCALLIQAVEYHLSGLSKSLRPALNLQAKWTMENTTALSKEMVL